MYGQWQSSGLSMKSFCEQKGIHRNTFYYWAKTIKKDKKLPATAPEKGFSQILVSQPHSNPCAQPVVIINFPNGSRIEFYYPVEASVIKPLIQ